MALFSCDVLYDFVVGKSVMSSMFAQSNEFNRISTTTRYQYARQNLPPQSPPTNNQLHETRSKHHDLLLRLMIL